MYTLVNVRRYRQGDEAALWQLYYDTTHLVNGQDYTPEQCERWAPASHDLKQWTERMKRTQPFVAEHGNGIVGFAELLDDGQIDFFYCHYQWQRKGIGTQLHNAIEEEARRRQLPELRADVSVSAKDFFLAQGFEVVEERNNLVCGSPAPNFLMRKLLND